MGGKLCYRMHVIVKGGPTEWSIWFEIGMIFRRMSKRISGSDLGCVGIQGSLDVAARFWFPECCVVWLRCAKDEVFGFYV